MYKQGNTMTNTYILIYPPITRSERYSSKFLGAAGGSQVPLGVLYIAAYLRKFGNGEYNIKFIDAEHESLTPEDTVNRVREYVMAGGGMKNNAISG